MKLDLAKIALFGSVLASGWIGLPSAGFAGALALPAAVWSGSANTGISVGGSCCTGVQHPVTGPGITSATQTNSSGSKAFSQLFGSDGPMPTLTASVSVDPSSDAITASALEQLVYYIQINGPVGFVPLKVLAHGSLSSTLNKNSSAFSQVDLGIGGGTFGYVSAQGGVVLGSSGPGLLPGFSPSAFTLSGTLSEYTNQPITVIMFIEASAQGPSAAAAATAYLDPYFFIDPSFANANLYTITTSSGIGNSPVNPVPEPSTWLISLLGLSALVLIRMNLSVCPRSFAALAEPSQHQPD